jgi:hypothetical protein
VPTCNFSRTREFSFGQGIGDRSRFSIMVADYVAV